MALPILDGNQSATTLSSILTGGEHIPAHTVVSLGTQAITDMQSAVSGSVVSISNFPATQPVSIASVTVGNSVTIGSLPAISGTVTANLRTDLYDTPNDQYLNRSALHIFNGDWNYPVGEVNPLPISGTVTIGSALPTGTNRIGVVTIGGGTVTIGAGTAQIGSVTASISNSLTISSLPAISGTVTIGNLPDATIPKDWGTIGDQLGAGLNAAGLSVDVASIPAISGTVTANVTGDAFTNTQGGIAADDGGGVQPNFGVQLGYFDGNDYRLVKPSHPLPISGAVTIGAGTAQIGSVTASISGTVPISISSVTVGNSVTIGSLPAISGTVTANTFALQGTAVTTSNFTSTTASTVLANFNATREVLTIFNEGAGNLHICAGATCTTIAYQVRLSAGDYYEVPNHQTTITHSAVFATAGTARVTEVS